MTLRNALNTGVSGLITEGRALGVVGDNVANLNTVGFKQSRAIFEDVLGGAVGGGNAPGFGVRMARTQQIFAQGTLLNTDVPTDVALSGDGFFIVRGSVGGVEGSFYTRAGQTTVRNDGTLVNPQGLALQGYRANPDGTFSSLLGPIEVPTTTLPPRATTRLDVTANLDSTAATPAAAFDPLNPGPTSNFSTAMTVYDSLGTPHTVSVYYRRTAANTWEYHALANGGELTGGVAGRNTEIAAGTLAFTPSGALQSNTVTAGGTVNFVGAVPAQPLAYNFGTSIAAGGTGLDGVTQFGSPSSVGAQSQDGYAPGDLNAVRIDGDGTVNGIFTNGETIAIGRLAVAKFRSNDGLDRAGHNLWTATRDSGEPAVGSAGTGGRGSIVAGSLEQSNVEVTEQFVDLIAHQRAFQANSKTITTADQMLQELMNISR
jgi:flagellar hook protein FlgE